jgi:hypothetical protein
VTGVLRLPESPRARRRLFWKALGGGVALGIGLLIAFDSNSGHSLQTPIDSNAKARVVAHPKTVPVGAADRKAAETNLMTFARTAVLRRDLAASWPLADATMRIGTTREQWLGGSLPVVPYPAGAVLNIGLRLLHSYRDDLGYEVLFVANKTALGKRTGTEAYACEMHHVGGRWLVDSCYPRKTL